MGCASFLKIMHPYRTHRVQRTNRFEVKSNQVTNSALRSESRAVGSEQWQLKELQMGSTDRRLLTALLLTLKRGRR